MVAHDAFMGDNAAQDDNEMEMRGDEGGNGITVDPGDTGELTHTFGECDELLIDCHQDGHYAAGMRVMANVSWRRGPRRLVCPYVLPHNLARRAKVKAMVVVSRARRTGHGARRHQMRTAGTRGDTRRQ